MFDDLQIPELDTLLSLMATFRADTRARKVDLVVGVYKDEAGNVPIMGAVKEAERRLVAQETTKTYVGIAGDEAFRQVVPDLVLGADHTLHGSGRLSAIQTPGGTGALKVACDVLQLAAPGKRLWMSTPTWANHVPVATGAGLDVASYPYLGSDGVSLDFDAMMEHLDQHAKPGDALLLHACCHNPTGVDLTLEHWKSVTGFLVARGVLPLVDCAYQGLADDSDRDAAGLRYLADQAPEMLIASSCSKNFGIYRERTGALMMVAASPASARNVAQAAHAVIRSNYSMPPSHGARIVATILQDEGLRRAWDNELSEMRRRIASVRTDLRERIEALNVGRDMSFLTRQRGMFSYTGFSADDVKWIRDTHGLYMAGDGRINVAGLNSGNIDAVAEAMAASFTRQG